MDESRKQFEEWVLSRPEAEYDDIVMRRGEYLRILTTFIWEAWQESRATIEIELPMKKAEHAHHQSAFNGGIDAAAKAIRAAGIKVKE